MAKGDGVFKIRNGKIYVHGTINGNFYRKSTGKKLTPATKVWIKKADPLKVLAEILSEVEITSNTSLNLENLAREALDIQLKARGMTHNHYKDKLSMLNKNILPYFKDRDIAEITAMDIINWLTLLKADYSNSRVKAIKNLFRSIFDYVRADKRLIDYSPFDSTLVKSMIFVPKRDTEVYTTKEVYEILTKSKGWLKLFLDISFKYGFRPGETIALKWQDIDFENGLLTINRFINNDNLLVENIEQQSKNKKHFRSVALHSSTLELLELHFKTREHEEWIFTNRLNKPFTQSRSIIDFHFKPFLKEINVPYKTLYAARRSYASIMNETGLKLEEIQKNMGHEKGSKVTEAHYISKNILTNADKRRAAIKEEILFNSIINSED
ncbi:tyrosine-type recombinase/integrase [Sulfurimonas sp.]